MFGTILAESCFKDERTLGEKGGGGTVEVGKEALQGWWRLRLGLEHPQVGGRYDFWVSEEEVESYEEVVGPGFEVA